MNRNLITVSLLLLIIWQIIACSSGKMINNNSTGSPEDNIYENIQNDNVPFIISTFELNIIPPSSGVQYYKDGIVFLASGCSREVFGDFFLP